MSEISKGLIYEDPNFESSVYNIHTTTTSKYRGDFIGFQFGDITSEDLRVVRVSDGSRYNEDLLPSFSDKTIQVPGSDQTYYFGSDFTDKPFNMNIAFDDLGEEEFLQLSQIFGTKIPQKLIFDERPYKYYIAKINTPPQFNYICFDEIDQNEVKHRVYKGEGTLSFSFFYPFAKSVANYLDDFSQDNKSEWQSSCRMAINAKTPYNGQPQLTDYYDKLKGSTIIVRNAGDKDMDWTLIVPFNDSISAFSLELLGMDCQLNCANGITPQNGDDAIQINSRNHLIEGLRLIQGEYKLSGTLYNKYITSGDFFKIPIYNKNGLSQRDWVLSGCPANSTIKYNYIYF